MSSTTAVRFSQRVSDSTLRLLDGIEARPRRTLAVYALLLAIQISPWWYASKDDCLYISVARSMVQAESIHCLGDSRIFVGPGFPALLSPAFLFGERPFLAMSIIQWFVSVLLIVGVYQWCLRHEPRHAALLTGFCVLNLTIWYYFRRPLKEIAFLTSMVWTVNLLHPLCDKLPWKTTAWRCAAGCAWLVYALFIRLTGAVLVPAFVAAVGWQAWHGRMSWMRAATLATVVGLAGGGAVLGQVIANRAPPETTVSRTSYAQEFAQRLSAASGSTLLTGVRDRIGEVGRIALPGLFKTYADTTGPLKPIELVFLAATAVLIVGWVALVRERIELLALSMPLFAGIYAANAVSQGARLAVAMSPILLLCFWTGLKRIARCDVRALGGLTVAHLAAAAVYWVGVDMPRARAAHRDWAAIDRIVETVGDEPVALGGELRTTRSMLIVGFDRMIPDFVADGADEDSRVASNRRAIVTSTDSPPQWIIARPNDQFAGYDRHSQQGDLALWRARDAEPATRIALPADDDAPRR